ncbi:MAG: NTP transferase domain-containing protein [Planctomycetota bacterium]
MDQKFSAIILAAGHGTRMKSSLPKILHKVLGVTVIDRVISSVRAAGADDLIMVLGHDAETVSGQLADTDIRVATQTEQLGTAHALLAAIEQQPPRHDDVLVVNGDLPDLDPDQLGSLMQSHRASDAAFTVGSCSVDEPTGMGRIVRSGQGTFERIVEQPDADSSIEAIHEVNLGIYTVGVAQVRPELQKMVDGDLAGADSAKESYLTDLVEVLIEAGIPVAACPSEGQQQFLQVNDRLGLARVSRVLQDRIHTRLLAEGVTIVDPVTTWIESDVEIGTDTVIHPQTVIRRGVKIGSHCQIGPFAHLREGTVIKDDVKVGDFVEIKDSTLEQGVRAKHLAYLGNTSVGEKANIGAGVVVANYDGKVKSPTRIGSGAFIGSGSVIVAPANIGDNATVGAGAVVPAGRDVEPGSTVIGVPARKIKRHDDSIPEICEEER